jgi:glycosyltransferase involved in cell wall biosynthesis
VYTAHGFYFHEEMPAFQYKAFYNVEKWAARFLTDWLLLQSKEDYELSLKDNFLRNKERVIHLSNGVDVYKKFSLSLIDQTTTQTILNENHIHHNDVVFSFIGRLVEEKGIFELLEAFHTLEQEHDNVKLILIGDFLESERDKNSHLKLKELMKSKQVIHLGFRKDIPELLSISDVFVLPSYREGLPRSIIEAMAMSKPIIATDIRGCREEVFQDRNGILVEKGSSESLFRAMKTLVLDEEKRTEFGKESRRIAEDQFNEQLVIDKQIKLFDLLTKDGNNEKII